MIIRKNQIESLEANSRQRFIDFMHDHLSTHFPDHYRALGFGVAGGAIETGISQAGKHGMISERDVCKFIDLQFAFGPSFDSDGSCPWATDILRDPEIRNPTSRVNALMDAAQAHLARLDGKSVRQ